MKCECPTHPSGRESDTFVTMPIRRPDDALETLVCLECARQHPAYCLTHDCPHIGFDDGTTACTSCINQLAHDHATHAQGWYDTIITQIPTDEVLALQELLAETADAIGESPQDTLLRWLATYASRTHTQILHVVAHIRVGHSILFVVPGLMD